MCRPLPLVGFSVLAVAVVTCSHFQPAPHPLYPGPARSPIEVARLGGPIAKVDGADVSSLGGNFALLPGCHVVELQRKIGEGSMSGAWSRDLGHRVYAFRMRPGWSYEIAVHLQPGNDAVGNGNVGQVTVQAIERDASGKTVANVLPVRKNADVEACQQWEEDQSKPEPSPPASASPDAGATDRG